MIRILRMALVVASTFFAATSASAATLLVDRSGQLVGAAGVVVDGAFYDVAFFDGTCQEAYGRCSGPDGRFNATANLAFQTESAAELAARALFDQVFLDGPLGAFDSQPDATRGCEGSTSCYALIPFAFRAGGLLSAVLAVNNTVDMTVQFDFGVSHDLRNVPTFTYARFTPQGATSAPGLSAVPLPAPLLFLLGGLAGLMGLRRSRRG